MIIIFGRNGLIKLVTYIKQIKAMLGGDIAELSSLLSESVQETESALDTKQDAPIYASCTIPVTGWASDSVSDYPKYYDLSIQGVTDKDHAQVMLSPASLSIASNCGLCCICETLNDKIRLRAKTIPTAEMTAEYWIEKGKENN